MRLLTHGPPVLHVGKLDAENASSATEITSSCVSSAKSGNQSPACLHRRTHGHATPQCTLTPSLVKRHLEITPRYRQITSAVTKTLLILLGHGSTQLRPRSAPSPAAIVEANIAASAAAISVAMVNAWCANLSASMPRTSLPHNPWRLTSLDNSMPVWHYALLVCVGKG